MQGLVKGCEVGAGTVRCGKAGRGGPSPGCYVTPRSSLNDLKATYMSKLDGLDQPSRRREGGLVQQRVDELPVHHRHQRGEGREDARYIGLSKAGPERGLRVFDDIDAYAKEKCVCVGGGGEPGAESKEEANEGAVSPAR